jgi:2-oxoisovalerate dehydrogenase E1 component
VSVFLEPIALYMTKDLFEAGDGQWSFAYPAPDQAVALGEPRLYGEDNTDLLIISYGNAMPMSLRVAKQLESERGIKTRVMDLRWLQPLNDTAIAAHGRACARILVVDEGRKSAGPGEGVITALVEGGCGGKPIARVCGTDTYTPLAGAANLVLPSDASIKAAAKALLRL